MNWVLVIALFVATLALVVDLGLIDTSNRQVALYALGWMLGYGLGVLRSG